MPCSSNISFISVFKDTHVTIKRWREFEGEFKDSSPYSSLPYVVCQRCSAGVWCSFILRPTAFLWKWTENETVLQVWSHFRCCALWRCPAHVVSDPDYHVQIKWVIKVIAGKAKIYKRAHLNSAVLKYAGDREGGQERAIEKGVKRRNANKRRSIHEPQTRREGEEQCRRRREEGADSKRRRGRAGVWRWQKASAGAARYCWDNLNSSAIFKS